MFACVESPDVSIAMYVKLVTIYSESDYCYLSILDQRSIILFCLNDNDNNTQTLYNTENKISQCT